MKNNIAIIFAGMRWRLLPRDLVKPSKMVSVLFIITFTAIYYVIKFGWYTLRDTPRTNSFRKLYAHECVCCDPSNWRRILVLFFKINIHNIRLNFRAFLNRTRCNFSALLARIVTTLNKLLWKICHNDPFDEQSECLTNFQIESYHLKRIAFS